MNAIISPATKFPSVRCAANPMISPRTAVDASSAPATARTSRDHEQRREQADADDHDHDRAAQDAVARQRPRGAVGPHDPAVDQAHRDGGDGEDDPDHEQALPQLHGVRFDGRTRVPQPTGRASCWNAPMRVQAWLAVTAAFAAAELLRGLAGVGARGRHRLHLRRPRERRSSSTGSCSSSSSRSPRACRDASSSPCGRRVPGALRSGWRSEAWSRSSPAQRSSSGSRRPATSRT